MLVYRKARRHAGVAATRTIALGAVFAALVPAPAATYQWVGLSGTGWSIGNNWVGAEAPPKNSYATWLQFNQDLGSANINSVNNISNGFELAELILQGQNWNLSGDSLSFATTGLITVSSETTTTLSNDIAIAAQSTGASGLLTLDVAGGDTLKMNGIVSGAHTLEISKGGTVDFNETNTLTGRLLVQSGTAVAGATNAFGSGQLAAIGGSINLNGMLATNSALIGNGSLALGTGGVLTLNGAGGMSSSFTGTVSGSGSQVVVTGNGDYYNFIGNNTGANSDVVVKNSAIYQLTSSNDFLGRDLILDGGQIDQQGFSLTVRNLTFGDGTTAGSLAQFTNPAMITVNKAINFFGNSAGTTGSVNVPNTLFLPANANVTVNFNGTVSNQAGGADVTLSGTVTGPGSLFTATNSTSPVPYLALTQAETYGGQTSVGMGTSLETLAVDAIPSISAVTLNQGANLYLYNPASPSVSYNQTVGDITGYGTVNLGTATLAVGYDNGSLVYNGEILGQQGSVFDKVGQGTLLLQGILTQSTSATIEIDSGGLELAPNYPQAFPNLGGSLTLNGGVFEMNSNPITVQNFQFGNGTSNYFGAIVDPGTITLNGNVIFDVGPTASTYFYYRTPTLLSSGVHQVEFTGGAATDPTLIDVITPISGAGGIEVTGPAGTLQFDSGASYAGPTILGAGPGANLDLELVLNSINALQDSSQVVDNGLIFLYANQIFNDLRGSGVIRLGTSTATLGADNLNNTFSGQIEGGGFVGSLSTGQVVKAGTGTTDLNSQSSQFGNLTVNSGSLVLASGQLQLDQSDSLDVAAGASLVVTHSGNLTALGQVTDDAGSLVVENDGGLQANLLSLGSGATFKVLKGSVIAGSISLSDDPSLYGVASISSPEGGYALSLGLGDVGSSLQLSFQDGNQGSGSMLKVGSGTLDVAASQFYTGGTTIQGGQFIADGAAFTGGFDVQNGTTFTAQNGATLNLGSAKLLAETGSSVALEDATLNGGFISGPGQITLASNNGFVPTLQGTTISNGATVQNNAAGAHLSNVSIAGNFVDSAGAWLDTSTITTSGTVTIQVTTAANNFTSSGLLIVPAGGQLNNSASSLVLGGRTYVGTVSAPGGLIDLGGQTLELNSGLLVNNGTIQNGLVNINFGSVAKGAGNYAGGYAINYGGQFVPGNSPGTVNSGAATWNEGGVFGFQIDNATGTAGENWGLNVVNGALTINGESTYSGVFTIDVESLTAGDAAGLLTNFNSGQNYSWTFLTASGGISGFNAADFMLDLSGFSNSYNGRFSLGLTPGGNGLSLNYQAVPSPSGVVAMGVGLVGLGVAGRRRRRVR